MCRWERASYYEPDVFLECPNIEELYQTMDYVREDFETVYDMAFGKIAFNEEDFKNSLEAIAHLLQVKSCHKPLILESKAC